jgi:hypothetical protein
LHTGVATSSPGATTVSVSRERTIGASKAIGAM